MSTVSYKPMRLKLAKSHLKTLCTGGRVKVLPAHHMLLNEAGGAVCMVHPDTYRRAAKCLKAGRHWHLRMRPEEIAASVAGAAEHGGGWSDFWDSAVDIGKKIIGGVAKYVAPIASIIADFLPPTHPALVALKAALKIGSQLAVSLDKQVNKADEAEERAAEASLELAEASEASEDAKEAARAAAKSKELSAEKKAHLRKLAEEARARVAAKKKASAAAEALAKSEQAKVDKLEKDKLAADKKARAAEKTALAAAEKAQAKSKK